MKVEHLSRWVPLLLFLVVAGVAAWRAVGFPEAAGGLPGPAVFPLLLASALGLCGVALGVQAFMEKPRATNSADSSTDTLETYGHPAALLAAMCGYAVLMPYMGFLSATSVFLFIALRIFGHSGGVRAWAFALTASVLLYGLFAWLMGVSLPEGWIV